MTRIIEKTVLRTNYLPLSITSNRPNLTYATHCVVKSIDELSNYKCFILFPYNHRKQPRILIFRENRMAVLELSRYLDSLLPPWRQKTGVVRHYHSGMSTEYLERAHAAFTLPNGSCRILVTTSAESTGIDHPDVDIVCVAGLQSTLAMLIQEFGRAARAPDSKGLAVLFHDPWVQDIKMDDFPSHSEDLDRPQTNMTATSSAKIRAGRASVALVNDKSCIREQFAKYLGDHCQNSKLPYLFLL